MTSTTSERCFPVDSSQICSLYASYAFEGNAVNTIMNIFPYKMPASLLNQVQNAQELDTVLNYALYSQEALSAWNCEKNPTRLRYQSTLLCALIAKNSNCQSNINETSIDLCPYVRDAYLESLMGLVSSKNCSLIETIKYEEVKNKINQLSIAKDAKNCSLGVSTDSTTCGFGKIDDMTKYCLDKNDVCCSAGTKVTPIPPKVTSNSLSPAAIICIALGGALLVVFCLLATCKMKKKSKTTIKKNTQDSRSVLHDGPLISRGPSLSPPAPGAHHTFPSLKAPVCTPSSSVLAVVDDSNENLAPVDTSSSTPAYADSSFSSNATLTKQDAVITRKEARLIAETFRATLSRGITHKSTGSQSSYS